MSLLSEILAEIPLSAIQRERIELIQAKHELETLRSNTEREDLKTKLETAQVQIQSLTEALKYEKENHALTRKELNELRTVIQKFSEKPKPSPEIQVKLPGKPFQSPI